MNTKVPIEASMLDPDAEYFPEPDSPAIISFSVSFVRLMFAQTRLDREIENLVGAVKRNQFIDDDLKLPIARKRPGWVAKIIHKHLGEIPEIGEIERQLHLSIPLYDFRNSLAHGAWWCFDPSKESISLRRDIVRDNENRFVEVAKLDVERTASDFTDIEVALYKIRRRIELRIQTSAGS
jgi:hypothetical protein